MTGRALARDERARRRPAARRLAADRRAGRRPPPGPVAAGPGPRRRRGAHARATPARSRSRSPGRGRWRRPSSGPAATGCSPTTAPAASWPRRWPRGCATTSPTSGAGSPTRTSSCRSTSPPCPPCWPGRIPTASGFHRHRSVDAPRASPALEWVFAAVTEAGATPVAHCCASDVPIGLLTGAGAAGVSVDLDVLPVAAYDDLGRPARAGPAGAPRGHPDHRARAAAVRRHRHRAGAALARHARARPRGRAVPGGHPVLRAGRGGPAVGAAGRCDSAGRSPPPSPDPGQTPTPSGTSSVARSSCLALRKSSTITVPSQIIPRRRGTRASRPR